MKQFLKIKHWQLFLISIAIPFGIMIYGNMQMIITHDMGFTMRLFPFLMLLFLGSLMGWMWALGTNLYKKLPETVSMKINKFKVFVIIPSIYMAFLCVFISSLLLGFAPGSISPLIALLIIPLHLFSMFCMFYNLYFISKSLKAVQLQRPVKFEDYAGEFFLIWFFFIGIWIIQPRINKIFAPETL